MKHQPHGRGTVYRAASSGRWIAQLSLGKDATGRRIRKTRSAATKREACANLRQLEAEYVRMDGTRRINPDSDRLADYLKRWYDHRTPNWSQRTAELYWHQIERHILPALGNHKIAELKPFHVQTMVDGIVREGIISTANKVRRLLYSALKQAVRWELIEKNPVDAIDPIREPTSELTLWTTEQAARFLEVHRHHRHYAAYYLLISSGLRRGELLGLRWEDIGPEGLRIRQVAKIVRNVPVLGPPKTKASRRYVSLAPDAMAVLEAHREAQNRRKALLGAACEHPELVFPSETGTIMDPKNFYRAWKQAVKHAGLPPVRIHDMRHLHVTLLIHAGIDAKTISERVGHTSTSFTLDQYGHVFRERHQQVARTMHELLGVEPFTPLPSEQPTATDTPVQSDSDAES